MFTHAHVYFLYVYVYLLDIVWKSKNWHWSITNLKAPKQVHININVHTNDRIGVSEMTRLTLLWHYSSPTVHLRKTNASTIGGDRETSVADRW